MSLNEKGLLPCPFCGGKPRVDLAKKTFCQLHGEPSQAVKVYCYHDCPARPSVESGDVFNGGEAKAREQAIAAWNRRAPASVPEDVAGVVERLRGYRPANEWGDPVQHTICDEAASALARVAKERDEARATLDEVCLSNRQEWQRATTAEAKLAEARKVIEPFAALEPPKHCRAFMQILVCPEGDTTPGDYSPHIRAARRFLEETK